MRTPIRIAASRPGRIMPFSTFISFSATVPASVMVAGTDRSILPGPSVITNIWPMPTMMEKAAKVKAACERPSVLAPPVTIMVANQTIEAAIHDQIQGFFARRRKEIIAAPPGSQCG